MLSVTANDIRISRFITVDVKHMDNKQKPLTFLQTFSFEILLTKSIRKIK